MNRVEIVVAHSERTTLRVGDTFLKVDANPTRLEHEARAIELAPIPTPEVLWCTPPVLAISAVPGLALGRLGEPSAASPAAWVAAGATVRMLHDAPLPPWPGPSVDQLAVPLAEECDWLIAHQVLPREVIERNRRIAEAVLRRPASVFTHGDLQITHIFTHNDEVTGVIDWSEAHQGDGLYDLATLTLGHEDRLREVVAGYGGDVDLDIIRGWWSWRSITAARWLIEHGFDPSSPGCEFDVLKAAG